MFTSCGWFFDDLGRLEPIQILSYAARAIQLAEEGGGAPLEAAFVGAKEVGFTLLSMNLSIVAVFVSILFMGGIVERLFREFSITLAAANIASRLVQGAIEKASPGVAVTGARNFGWSAAGTFEDMVTNGA